MPQKNSKDKQKFGPEKSFKESENKNKKEKKRQANKRFLKVKHLQKRNL